MEMNKEEIRALAEKIYDLDTEVYTLLGSNISRVFGTNKERSVRFLMEMLGTRSDAFRVRSELALISNMARTIPDRRAKTNIMSKYNEILKEVKAMPTSFADGDILDPKIADLNITNLKDRFHEGDHKIICIGRTCGSGGTDIGFRLADTLHMNFYDVSVMNEVFKQIEGEDAVQGHETLQKDEQGNPVIWFKNFVRFHGLTENDELFFETSKVLIEKAKTEDFVVMGRFADAILTNNHIPHLSIFITAPEKRRIERVMSINAHLNAKTAKQHLEEEDAKHLKRYHFYTGRSWGTASNYDLCVNSATYGLQGSVDLIMRVLNEG